MPELWIRAGLKDVQLIEGVMSGSRTLSPDRLVVDAHVAQRAPGLAAAAAQAGRPFLIDPQTHLLQGEVHPLTSWAALPFSVTRRLTPTHLLDRKRVRAHVATVFEFQLGHGASHLIAPYVHIEAADDGWADAQIALWEAARDEVDANGLRVPLIPVLALGWRLHARTRWPSALARLMPALEDLGVDELALASSKVDQGVDPGPRLVDMLSVVRRLSREYRVYAWQQGALGEAAVVAGAEGYETGIGWREHCDLRRDLGAHRDAPTGGGKPQPTYIADLRRGIDRSVLRAASTSTSLMGSLACMDPSCCPGGVRDLLADGRAHTIRARLTSLRRTVAPAHESWRWEQLFADASRGLALANRVNRYTRRLGADAPNKIPTGALAATVAVAAQRRRSARGTRPA